MHQRLRGQRGSGSIERRGDKWYVRRSDTNPVTGERRRWRESFDTKKQAEQAQAIPTNWTADATTPAHEWLLGWAARNAGGWGPGADPARGWVASMSVLTA